jgi:hypothetical protein
MKMQTRKQSAPEMVLETMAEYHELHERAVSTKFFSVKHDQKLPSEPARNAVRH